MWKPNDYDLEWSKNLFNSLKKDGGVWMFSATGKMNEPVLGTPDEPTSTASFTRNGNKMTLTDIKIIKLNDLEFMHNRIKMAKTCFEAIGVECETKGTVESALLNLVDESK